MPVTAVITVVCAAAFFASLALPHSLVRDASLGFLPSASKKHGAQVTETSLSFQDSKEKLQCPGHAT